MYSTNNNQHTILSQSQKDFDTNVTFSFFQRFLWEQFKTRIYKNIGILNIQDNGPQIPSRKSYKKIFFKQSLEQISDTRRGEKYLLVCRHFVWKKKFSGCCYTFYWHHFGKIPNDIVLSQIQLGCCSDHTIYSLAKKIGHC